MRLLSRYVATTVLGAVGIVLLIVVGIDAMASLVDGVGDIRNRYQFTDVLYNTLLEVPSSAYINLPFAALIGCLLGMGLMAGNSELVVMRTAGVSLLRIAGFVMRPVLVLVAIGVVVGEWVVPFTDQLAESRRMVLRGEQKMLSATSGVWNREGNEFVHFNAVYPNGQLYGVTRYQFNSEQQLQAASYAQRATYMGTHWQEEQGEVTQFNANGTAVSTFEVREWRTPMSPDLLQLLVMPPESLSMRSLHRYGNYLEEQGQESARYWLSFWSKALQPAIVLSLVLIAISFIFGPLREATMGYRIFSGVLVGIAFRTSQELLGPSSVVFGFSPFWAVLAPVLVSCLIGVILLRRAA